MQNNREVYNVEIQLKLLTTVKKSELRVKNPSFRRIKGIIKDKKISFLRGLDYIKRRKSERMRNV